jgi:hypothetical protein
MPGNLPTYLWETPDTGPLDTAGHPAALAQEQALPSISGPVPRYAVPGPSEGSEGSMAGLRPVQSELLGNSLMGNRQERASGQAVGAQPQYGNQNQGRRPNGGIEAHLTPEQMMAWADEQTQQFLNSRPDGSSSVDPALIRDNGVSTLHSYMDDVPVDRSQSDSYLSERDALRQMRDSQGRNGH